MSSQVRPLHAIHDRNLCAPRPGKLIKLRWAPRWQRVGDVTSGLLRMIARQRLAHSPAAQMEAPPWLRSPARRGAHIHLLRGSGAVSADLTGGDVEGFLAEQIAREDVGDAQDGDEDAGSDDEAPVVVSEGLFGGGCFVEIAEEGDAEDYHEDAESYEAG